MSVLETLPLLLFIAIGWFLKDPVTLLSNFILTLVLTTYYLLNKDFSVTRSKRFYLLIGILTVYIVSTFINHVNVVLAIQGTYQRNIGLSYFLNIALLFSIISTGQLKFQRSLHILNFLLSISLIYGLVQKIDLDPLKWSNPYDAIQLTLGNPNFAGAFLGMIGVLPVYNLVRKKIELKSIISCCLVSIALLYVGSGTKSLQFWIVYLTSNLIFVLILLYSQYKEYRKYIVAVAVTSFLTIFTTLYALLFSNLTRLSRFRSYLFAEGNVSQRIDYWQNGLQMFANNPIFGVGPDQFQRNAALYRDAAQVNRDGVYLIPDKAHNLVIDHLANGGILAALLWLIFVASIFHAIVVLASSELAMNLKKILALWSGIWTAYIIQSLISPDQIQLAVIGIVSAGHIVALGKVYPLKREQFRSSDKIQIAHRVVIFSLLSATLFVWVNTLIADRQARNILRSEKIVENEIKDLVLGWPMPKNWHEIAVAYSKSEGACRTLPYVADRLLELNGFDSQAFYMKAYCANEFGELRNAFNYVESALRFDPMNSDYLISKAKLALALKDVPALEASIRELNSRFPANSEIPRLLASLASLRS